MDGWNEEKQIIFLYHIVFIALVVMTFLIIFYVNHITTVDKAYTCEVNGFDGWGKNTYNLENGYVECYNYYYEKHIQKIERKVIKIIKKDD